MSLLMLCPLLSKRTHEPPEASLSFEYGSFGEDVWEGLPKRDVMREKNFVLATLLKNAGVAGRQAHVTPKTGSRLVKTSATDVLSADTIQRG